MWLTASRSKYGPSFAHVGDHPGKSGLVLSWLIRTIEEDGAWLATKARPGRLLGAGYLVDELSSGLEWFALHRITGTRQHPVPGVRR